MTMFGTLRSPTLDELVIETIDLAGIGRSNNRLMALSDEILHRLVEEAQANDHTTECITVQLAYVAWRTKHPRACVRCYATGEVDDSDASVGLYGDAPCGVCVLNGQCPRCSHGITFIGADDDSDAICLKCGWKTGAASDMPQYECRCWVDAESMYAQAHAEFGV